MKKQDGQTMQVAFFSFDESNKECRSGELEGKITDNGNFVEIEFDGELIAKPIEELAEPGWRVYAFSNSLYTAFAYTVQGARLKMLTFWLHKRDKLKKQFLYTDECAKAIGESKI